MNKYKCSKCSKKFEIEHEVTKENALCTPCFNAFKGLGYKESREFLEDMSTNWRKLLYHLDIADPESKGSTITLGEYLRKDCLELEDFIDNLLSQAKAKKGKS